MMKENRPIHDVLDVDSKDIETIKKMLGTPDITADKKFSKELKKQLHKKIQEKKSQDPKYFAFYLKHFRFYFSGFSVALGVFCILFVLGFFTFNKSPKLLNNPKTLNYTNEMAFGNISSKKAHKENDLSFVDSRLISPLFSEGQKHSVITQQVNRYHIGENQFPSLKEKYYIVKEKISENKIMKDALKGVRIPDFNLLASDANVLENIEFTNSGYHFTINLANPRLDMQMIDFYGEANAINPDVSFRQIKKYIKRILSDFGLSLKNYGEAQVVDNSDPDVVHLFFPKLIDGKEVWDGKSFKQQGMDIIFNKKRNLIESLQNMELLSYTLSSYPLKKTIPVLLENLKNHGNIDTSKKGEKESVKMRNGKEIYLKKNALFIPALLFSSDVEGIDKVIILPLY